MLPATHMLEHCPAATPVEHCPAAESAGHEQVPEPGTRGQRQCVRPVAPAAMGFLSYQCSRCQGPSPASESQCSHLQATPKAIPFLVTTESHPEVTGIKKGLYQGPNARDVKVRALSFQKVPGLSENTCNTYALGERTLIWVIETLKNLCLHSQLSREHLHKKKKKKQKGLVMAYQVPLNQGLSLPNCERPEPAFSSFQPTVETTPTLASRHLRKYKLLFQSRVEGGMQTFCRSRSRPLWRSSGRTAPNKLSTL